MTTLSAKTEFVLVSTNGAASVVLFDAAKIPGHRVTIKHDTTQLGTTTITSAGGNIDSGSSASLTGANQYIELEAWGGKWRIIDSSAPFVGVLGAGVVHSDSSGNLTSSKIINADVDSAAGIVYTKLALTGGIVNGDVNASAAILVSKLAGDTTKWLASAAGIAGWATVGGDWDGPASATVVRGLTGTTNVVAMHGTKILFDLGGASGAYVATESGFSGHDLALQGGTISFYEGANLIGYTQYNSGQAFFRLSTPAARYSILADSGTSQSILIRVAGTTPAGLLLSADDVQFMKGDTTIKGHWTNTGLRIGDAATPAQALEVVGTARLTALTAGLTRSNSTGVLATLADGTSGQYLVSVTTTPTWVTAGGDWSGAVDANVVKGLTGTTGTVAMHGTSITWDSAGPILAKGGIGGNGMVLKLGSANEYFNFTETTNDIAYLFYNAGNPVLQFQGTSNLIQANAAGQQLNLRANTSGQLGLFCDTISFGDSAEVQKGRWVGSGLEVGAGLIVGNQGTGGDTGNKNTQCNGSGLEANTTATSGFVYIPTCNGPPTGSPSLAAGSGQVPMIYDRANNKLWINIGGSTWKFVTLT